MTVPRKAHPGWLFLAAVLAAVAGRPFWSLWHPLGWVVAVAVFLLLWWSLWGRGRLWPFRRRHASAAVAAVVVRRG